MKKHREPAENCRLKSVTVSMEPSGKYFASLLYEGYSCENQAVDKDYSNAKILGIDYAMQGMAVFSEEIEMEEAGFFRKNEKRLAREQRKLSRPHLPRKTDFGTSSSPATALHMISTALTPFMR